MSALEQEAAGPFTVAHFRDWAAGLVLDSGAFWVLEPFQEKFAEDLFAGWQECWLIVPEGNGKTTLVAGLVLYHCQFRSAAWVPVAASSRDQAEILYRQAEGFVFRSDSIRDVFKCQEGYRRIKCPANGSRIQVMAADASTGDGVIPTLAICDELHRHRSMRLYETWSGKLGKRGGQLVTISTAGEPGSDFELMRERMRQAGEPRREEGFVRAAAAETVLHEWAVPEGGDVEDMRVVKTANPFSGITVDSLSKKFTKASTTLPHWRRFTCNLPTRSDSAAIQEGEWYAARSDVRIPKGQPVWLGLDLGWKWDTTAAVPLWWRDDHFRLFGKPRILTPPRDSTSLDPNLVEQALLEIHTANPIHTVVMDMSRGEQLAAWCESELGSVVVDRSQGNAFAADDYERFTEALRSGWLKHDGDVEFTRHVLNAVSRILPLGDAKFERPSQTRMGGDQDRRVIDALTAAAMVHAVAATNKPKQGRVLTSNPW